MQRSGRTYPIYTFPVKHHWREPADISLIVRSAMQLSELVDHYGDKTVVIPRPGCGNGKLSGKMLSLLLKIF